jgi:DNA-directed RNA polymerase subunit RPC12/RpoP
MQIYHRKPLEVLAIQLEKQFTHSGVTGQPGDYLVKFPDGSVGIMKRDLFELHFVPEAPPAPEYNPLELLLGQRVHPNSPLAEPVDYQPPIRPPLIRPQDPDKPFENRASETLFTCIGCGREVPEKIFEKTSGQCADCLKKLVTCYSCGARIFAYQQLGTTCINCMSKEPLTIPR